MSSPKPLREPSNVLSHWYVVIENVQFSAQDLYRSLEADLAEREVPRLRISRVELKEGGFGSDKRIYLRLARERYAFDVCAAPFGTDYFFSMRLVEKPRDGWWQLLGLLVAAGLLVVASMRNWLSVVYVLGVTALNWLIYWGVTTSKQGSSRAYYAESKHARPAVSDFLDFDGFLLNLPFVGAVYERLRRDTYHRYDTRLVFQTLVTEIVKRKVEALTAAKGIQLTNAYEYSPILGEIYKRATTMAEVAKKETAHAVG